MKIGEKIRAAREDMDLTQTEVAARIPMNQSNYSKIERNQQEPDLTQLKRICEILSLDANALLGLSEPPISADDRQLLCEIKQLIGKYGKK